MEQRIFNLSLDDQSPYPTAGLNFEAVNWCDKLIKRWPDLKIDLFVPAAYTRLGDTNFAFLTKYPDWVKRMNDLPRENYRINPHGYFHARLSAGKHPKSNNDEFQYLSEQQASTVLGHMLGEFEAAGLKYEKVFRAPGWKLSTSTAKVLTELGFTIAGNQHYYDVLKDRVPGMCYLITNWELREDCVLKGNVFAAGHTSTWCDNFFDEKVYNRVVRLLEAGEFEFKFLGEL